ncbi:nickel pincer cofactor biosynthesis protein LarB [Halodesulfovibrio sp. MK-HDV]|uniref:nickel pincer cofactor biosynthesis protein LarB n=1 Tax=Halodesulfovibrio sp. MK-HDV TaxID=2599925 RepID=UPI0013F88155|nr:nickel pincer cofactor biosynthesis protein LarB [Halodesulfovibrio sp. MK-HDV]KAF1077455.1 Pyridinium-3,5-biscarboxylic acid mononucleotide synthase [Halodesulfovibrio sp. MK-HDV]
MASQDTKKNRSPMQDDTLHSAQSREHSCMVSNHTLLDHGRPQRTGCPEVIFCEGKTPAQVASIFQEMINTHGECLGTRASKEHFDAVQKAIPNVRFNTDARTLIFDDSNKKKIGCVLVINAGTSDHCVAEEAAQTAEFLGSNVLRHFDCGVAGVHRALHAAKDFTKASAIVAVAGMDGALPTVVAGLSPAPVIAVPTSVGYGTGLGGVAALMTMLNGCAPGVSVVNIDNGFGAGYQAHIINTMAYHNR